MRICLFGTYRKTNAHNLALIHGLGMNKVHVFECHVPLKQSYVAGEKFFGNISPLGYLLQFFPTQIKLLVKYLSTPPHDIILVGYLGQFDMFLAWLLSRVYRRPLIFDPLLSLYDTIVVDRGMVKRKSLQAKALYFVDWISLRLADIVFIDTNTNISYYSRVFKLPKSKFRRVFAGAHPHSIKTCKKKAGKFTVLFWGTFTPLHGVEAIVRAAKLLENQDMQLKLIGSGQLSKKIARLKAKLHLKNVAIHSEWVQFDDLAKEIINADVCLGIFGKTKKAQRVVPFKVFEALCLGKPIVTLDSPAAKEVLADGANAILVPSSPQKIASALLRLKNSCRLRNKIASNALATYKKSLSTYEIGKLARNNVEELLATF